MWPHTKKKETLSFAVTGANLEDMVLTEPSQTRKDKHRMISLKCGTLGGGTPEQGGEWARRRMAIWRSRGRKE